MRIPLVVFMCLFCLACNPRISAPLNNNEDRSTNQTNSVKNHFDDWYDSFLEDGEKKLYSDYITLVSQKANGNYIKRTFFPDTKTMTHYNEFLNRNMSVKHGSEKIWSDAGILTYEVQYSEGDELGLARRFDRKSGKVVSEGNFRLSEKVGIWKSYDPNGVLKTETTYKKGIKSGKFLSYTDTGEISIKAEYRADTIYNSQILKLDESMRPLTRSEQMPMYGDGCPEEETMEAKQKCSALKMVTELYRNIRYPAEAREYGLQGKAYATFVVDTSGKMIELEIVRGLSQEISDEVKRVVQLLDTWVPGEQDGKKVKVRYTLPVNFKLE